MKYSAVIFDLDGTLLDNEEIYCQAFVRVLKKHKVDFAKSCPHTPGIGLRENWVKMKETFGIDHNVSVSQLAHETQDVYHSLLDKVKVRPGFYELHQALLDEGIIIALATSNDWWVVEDELEDLDLHKYFETVTTGEEVAHKKPAPDIFLEAARKLGVEPALCAVLEDSVAGIEAAKEAGMVVISVGLASGADHSVEDFTQITPGLLDSLFLH